MRSNPMGAPCDVCALPMTLRVPDKFALMCPVGHIAVVPYLEQRPDDYDPLDNYTSEKAGLVRQWVTFMLAPVRDHEHLALWGFWIPVLDSAVAFDDVEWDVPGEPSRWRVCPNSMEWEFPRDQLLWEATPLWVAK